MRRLTKRQVTELQAETLDWYQSHARRLPWRETQDPYEILVSEIMLQQTQVSRVIHKYQAFLTQFPAVGDLARASRASVITAWQGLGYNRRALNLQRAAQMVVEQYDGQLPADLLAMRLLPGIGRYTAGAILNFAFNIDTPAVDTNVKRFIDHFLPTHPIPTRRVGMPESVVFQARSEKEYYELAEQLMPKGKARTWLHAVMDYSALVLRPLGLTRRVKPRKKSEPFIGSNRYLRGRTIDQLRQSAQTLDELFLRVAAPINVERGRFHQLVFALQDEGFLERRGQLLQLQSSS